MDGGVEEAFVAALGTLAVAGVLFDVGDQARIENGLSLPDSFSKPFLSPYGMIISEVVSSYMLC